MSISIVMLFSKDITREPPGIFQCNKSGEYFPFYFFDWRDGVHFIQWCKHTNVMESTKSFNMWCKKYGYDENEIFNGDLNEFKYDNDIYIDVFGPDTPIEICDDYDLNKMSVWK